MYFPLLDISGGDQSDFPHTLGMFVSEVIKLPFKQESFGFPLFLNRYIDFAIKEMIVLLSRSRSFCSYDEVEFFNEYCFQCFPTVNFPDVLLTCSLHLYIFFIVLMYGSQNFVNSNHQIYLVNGVLVL